MTWETVIGGALQGISNFVTSFVSIIGGSLNSATIEGLLALFAIAAIYRIFQGGVRMPKLPKKKKGDDDEEYEWVMVKRRK